MEFTINCSAINCSGDDLDTTTTRDEDHAYDAANDSHISDPSEILDCEGSSNYSPSHEFKAAVTATRNALATRVNTVHPWSHALVLLQPIPPLHIPPPSVDERLTRLEARFAALDGKLSAVDIAAREHEKDVSMRLDRIEILLSRLVNKV